MARAINFGRDFPEGVRLCTEYPHLFTMTPTALAMLMGGTAHAGPPPPQPASSPQSDPQPDPEPAPTPKRAFDGTLGGLVGVYKTHPEAGLDKLKYRVRVRQNQLLNQVVDNYGGVQLHDIKASTLTAWYDEQRGEDDKVATAHAVIGRIKALLVFGVKILEDPECIRLLAIARAMRFETPKARAEQLTREQATAIRKMAHEMGKPSIALAQALQTDLGLMQRDVLGEWLPFSEPGISEIKHGNMKWLRGLQWSNIKDGRIKFKAGNYGKGKPKEIDVALTDLPMVSQEIALMAWKDPNNKKIGPMVICEANDRPWNAGEFRRWWRIIADKVEVPRNVKNADTRPREAASKAG